MRWKNREMVKSQINLYEVIYQVYPYHDTYKSIVCAIDEIQAINAFRENGSRHETADIIHIKRFEIKGEQ